jgi:predicted GH43/DUF377 family glycosyl hydrolase
MPMLQRYAFNPIFKPNVNHDWESLNIFNAGAIYHNGLFHLLYRAQGRDYVSHIGYAVSEDGLHWNRLEQPVFSPGNEYETRGVEDPRLTCLEGKFYMTYTGYSPIGVRASFAVSDNLISWQRTGILLPDENNKDTAIFPEKINGKYYLLHRREPDIWLADSTDLIHWQNHRVIMQPVGDSWQQAKIGIAGTPEKTDLGWLLIYHAVDKDMVYRLGAALLDLENPAIVLKRLSEPILEPRETWELKGDVPNVVFSCGQVIRDGTLYVYYGGADRVMAVATCVVEDLLNALNLSTQ